MITPFLYLIGGIMMFGLLSVWLGLTSAGVVLAPHVDFITYGPSVLGYIGIFNFIFALGIPLLVIVLSIAKRIFKFKINKGVTVGLIIFAVVNFFSLASIIGRTAEDFKAKSDQYTNIINGMHDTDTLHLHIVESSKESFGPIHLGDHVDFVDDALRIGIIKIDVNKSDKNDFEVELVKSGRGKNSVNAENYLNQVDYEVKVEGNHVYVPDAYVIPEGGKFRAQEMRLTFDIPEGKYISFDKSVRSDHIDHMDIDEAYSREFSNDGMVWKMGDKGMTNELAKREQFEDFQDFEKLDITGNFRVYVEQSDKFEIRTVGDNHNHYKTEINKVGGLLEIRNGQKRTRNPIKLYIRMPQLEQIKLTNTNDVKIMDFKGENLVIDNNGRNTEIDAHVDIENLVIKMEGSNSELELMGNGNAVIAELSAGVTLDAGTFQAKEVTLNGKNANEIYIYATDKLVDNTQYAKKVKNKYEIDTPHKVTIGFSADEGVTIKKPEEQQENE